PLVGHHDRTGRNDGAAATSRNASPPWLASGLGVPRDGEAHLRFCRQGAELLVFANVAGPLAGAHWHPPSLPWAAPCCRIVLPQSRPRGVGQRRANGWPPPFGRDLAAWTAAPSIGRDEGLRLPRPIPSPHRDRSSFAAERRLVNSWWRTIMALRKF